MPPNLQKIQLKSKEEYFKAFVSDCCQTLLDHKDKESLTAWNYLVDERKLNEATMKEHFIGYCSYINLPKDVPWGNFYIKDKLIIPIATEFGDITAIATRKPSSEKGNTWWNTVFQKGENLFLLNKSRQHIFKNNKVYLVEGYMDALKLYQEGVKNVVAIMGTKLTLRMIGLLARYCNNVCFCLDVDENKSGQKAQDRSIDLIRSVGVCDHITVIDDMPVGDDPAEYVSKNGVEKFLSLERHLSEEELRKIHERVKKSK